MGASMAGGRDRAELKVVCGYDKVGVATASTAVPQFLVKDQGVRVGGKAFKVKSIENVGTGLNATYAAGTVGTYTSVKLTALEASGAISADAKGQIIGSAYGEATIDPDGWKDELYTREGYCQIFKTGIQLFSGTALDSRDRGRPDEYRRVW